MKELRKSALRELEALAGTGLAGLFALFFAGIAGDVAGLLQGDRKSTRLNSSHGTTSRMPSSA